MITAWATRAAGLRQSGAILLVVGGLAGCAAATAPAQAPQAASGSGAVADGQPAPGEAVEPPLPAGAIAVGPDLYQIPTGEDAAGCVIYRLYSPTRMVSQAIAWRRADGSFTLDRREAECAR